VIYVIDASVAGKWFLPPAEETLVAEAIALRTRFERGEIEFAAPDLFWTELTNISWMAIRRKRWTPGAAEAALMHVRGYEFRIVPCKSLMRRAFEIAVSYDRSVYDCMYIALALQAKTELITADEKLVNALAGDLPVRWLGAFL
jgi:predicted nucleic acid-binding protein